MTICVYLEKEKKVKVTQLCLTLCNPMDYTVPGILQARILEWVAFPFFPTQGSNPGPPHCRQILYQLSHQGSPGAWMGMVFRSRKQGVVPGGMILLPVGLLLYL